MIIRSGPVLTADTGCNYACAILKIFFKEMGMPDLKAERSGQDFGVSYVLLSEKKKYCFRGYPDFVVHEDDVGASRILVATGEIQSTKNPAIQNSIYGIGCLLKNVETRPIICLSIFKEKSAQLLVARLQSLDGEGEGHETAVGTVTLKFVASPTPINLKTKNGIMALARRLYYVLKR